VTARLTPPIYTRRNKLVLTLLLSVAHFFHFLQCHLFLFYLHSIVDFKLLPHICIKDISLSLIVFALAVSGLLYGRSTRCGCTLARSTVQPWDRPGWRYLKYSILNPTTFSECATPLCMRVYLLFAVSWMQASKRIVMRHHHSFTQNCPRFASFSLACYCSNFCVISIISLR
jgi:hypothetical protein